MSNYCRNKFGSDVPYACNITAFLAYDAANSLQRHMKINYLNGVIITVLAKCCGCVSCSESILDNLQTVTSLKNLK